MLLPELVFRPETFSRDKLFNYSERHSILGLTIDTRSMIVALPTDKLTKIKEVLQQHFTHEHFKPFHAATLLGLIRHASLCLWRLPIFMASLQTAPTEAIRAHSNTFNEYWSNHIKGHKTYRLNYKQPEQEKQELVRLTSGPQLSLKLNSLWIFDQIFCLSTNFSTVLPTKSKLVSPTSSNAQHICTAMMTLAKKVLVPYAITPKLSFTSNVNQLS